MTIKYIVSSKGNLSGEDESFDIWEDAVWNAEDRIKTQFGHIITIYQTTAGTATLLAAEGHHRDCCIISWRGKGSK